MCALASVTSNALMQECLLRGTSPENNPLDIGLHETDKRVTGNVTINRQCYSACLELTCR
eukprot:scaffold16715_cov80-Cyclotella_meneghiniana.AAC.4